MFYCKNCAEKYGYPETDFKSLGICEVCGKVHFCNDRPSHLLPKPKKRMKTKTEFIVRLNLIKKPFFISCFYILPSFALINNRNHYSYRFGFLILDVNLKIYK